MTVSRTFSPRAKRGLDRIGDLIIPGSVAFPSFSDFGGSARIEELARFLPREDQDSLHMFLVVISVFPTPLLRGLAGLLNRAMTSRLPGSPLFRKINMGIRGLVFAIYYGGKAGKDYEGPDPRALIGFRVFRSLLE